MLPKVNGYILYQYEIILYSTLALIYYRLSCQGSSRGDQGWGAHYEVMSSIYSLGICPRCFNLGKQMTQCLNECGTLYETFDPKSWGQRMAKLMSIIQSSSPRSLKWAVRIRSPPTRDWTTTRYPHMDWRLFCQHHQPCSSELSQLRKAIVNSKVVVDFVNRHTVPCFGAHSSLRLAYLHLKFFTFWGLGDMLKLWAELKQKWVGFCWSILWQKL